MKNAVGIKNGVPKLETLKRLGIDYPEVLKYWKVFLSHCPFLLMFRIEQCKHLPFTQ